MSAGPPAAGASTRWVRNAFFGAATAGTMAAEDPTLLVIQAFRRLPHGARRRAARVLRAVGGPAREVLAPWVVGHDDAARHAVVRALPLSRGRTRVLLAEIAVLLGLDDLAWYGTPGTRARALWRTGQVTEAIETAGRATPLGRRLASERASMTPGRDLRTRAPVPGGSAAPGMRVLHLLTNSFPHTPSGYAVRSHQVLLAQQGAGIEVAALTRLGYPVAVGLVGAREVDVVDGVTYRRLVPPRPARTVGGRMQQNLELARPVVAALRPRVLHTTTNYTNALVTRALARESGLPWVYEARGILEDTWVASFPAQRQAQVRASERHRLLRAREAELARDADRVVTLGETVRDDLVARGVDPERIRVMPNAVDATLLEVRVDPREARHAVGLPEDGFWVGTVSSLVDYEGIETLIEAVAHARAAGLDVRALVVGDGVARPALEKVSEHRGVSEYVVFPGRVPASESSGWYLALDAFALPRRDTAVTRTVVPLKPMQAMALGRPVIASDLPALAEIVGVPGGGLMVEPSSPQSLAEAIARLAGDAELRAELAAAGREFASTRTWGAVGRSYRALYEELG